MATRVRTLDFLPEIFRTESNSQFLGATLDQLVTPPKLDKIEGYIGRKFEYGLTASDSYIVEPNNVRQQYQFEPGVVFTKTNTSTAVDFLTYPGLVDALAAENGSVINHSKLFANQFYSWDSFVDLDKLVNFSQYYWLPDGPDVVDVRTSLLYNKLDYVVTNQSINYQISANDVSLGSNPIITLLRGGTYTFNVQQPNKFYIQTSPGTSGKNPSRTNLSNREIYGLDNNGIDSGFMTFTVPYATDQDNVKYSGNNPVDIVCTLPFDQVHGKPLSQLKEIDGVNSLRDRTLMFYGFAPGTTAKLTNFYDNVAFDDVTFDGGDTTVITNNFYKINYVSEDSGDPVVVLTESKVIPTNQRITAIFGETFISRDFAKNQAGEIILLPQITADLDTLYYQDAVDPNKTGIIRLVEDNISHSIYVDRDIVGKKNYISPFGVKFTNGMKVNFVGSVFPESYKDKKYYVDGVGIGIELVPETDLLVPETFSQTVYKSYDNEGFDTSTYSERLNVPVVKDYITIDRNAKNRNAWSRSNRWFHIDVLKATATYSSGKISNAALNNANNRASRPIIEFYPNLKLYNSGTIHKTFVDFIDTTATNANIQISGQTSYIPDGTLSLFDGATIVFTNDTNVDVRNKIFTVKFQKITGSGASVITLTKANNGDVLANEQVVATRGTDNVGKTYYFNGSTWIYSQAKTLINQPPIFDVFDINGISFGNQSYYQGSDFKGSKLFSYSTGTGGDDAVLGFPIKYSSVSNIGDISFTVNFNSDTFNFIKNFVSTTYKITDGFVHNQTSRTGYNRKIGWETAIGESFQYQAFDFEYVVNVNSPALKFNVLPVTSSPWPTVRVFFDSTEQDSSTFTVATANNQTTITLLSPPSIDTMMQVLIYSNDPLDSKAYFTIPSNLSNNPFNVDISELSLGDLRGHYQSIYNNSRKITGDVFGANNFRDAGNLLPYSTKIIRNSASMVNVAAFMRNKEYNLIDALTFNAQEYVKFKQLMLSTVEQSEYDPTMSGSYMLDDVLQQIASYKQESDSFFWSDMLPARAPYISKTYTFNAFIDTSFFPLSKIYDFKNANYNSVLVYSKNTIGGIDRYTQLIKDLDYTISNTQPKLQITKDLVAGDTIIINEYNTTYGSYVPNTPSKLGMYPASRPGIILDNSYLIPTYFIKGHDGSLTKLYGAYNNGYLEDFKDKVLLEFETRVYNNIKVSAPIPIKEEEIIPGYFRNTGNTIEEVEKIYSANFLDWVGKNRIDFANHFYSTSEKFTWNYNNATDKYNKPITNGFWRGIYLWYFDTSTPHTTPWEMLGLVNKPSWWDTKYGEAPYTGDNKVLWADIEAGRVNGVVNSRRARPGLSKIIPVDSYGNLKNPFNTLVRDYSKCDFTKPWVVSDVGPAEYSYRRSSNWPFDLMKITALLKPAKFFSLAQDLDLYTYSSEFNQFLLDPFTHGGKVTLTYGNGTAQHSYMNWIVDYVQRTGYMGYDNVRMLLSNLDVRLIYRIAGFTDKEYLNFYLEKSSTNSSNVSLLLPSESFNVVLYQNQPEFIVSYSSIIIQRTSKGYSVSGNNQTRAYFMTYISDINGSYTVIEVNGVKVNIPNNYDSDIIYVPYGTVFTTPQELSEFIINYGRYLSDQGLKFENQENGFILNWEQMVAEALYWVGSNWEVGSLVSINPIANRLVIDNDSLIVQPLSAQDKNFILNQNLYAIHSSDLAIMRNDTRFEVRPLNDGDTISYFTASLNSLEHGIVFDNKSLFNDTIYNSTTGLRQNRLFLRGSKTAEWNGTLNAQGFILNQDNIDDWSSNVKYAKGSIVTYQNKYWMANKTVLASMTFNSNDWLETDYEQIQKGLLPNASTRASESALYYDVKNANLKNDGDLLGFSLIGYRPRDYLAAGDLSDISQVNLFKSFISEKGSKNIINAVQNITLDVGQIKYDVYENWAIKTSEYGGITNHNFIELPLNKTALTGNPNIIGVVKDIAEPGLLQTVPLYGLTNFGSAITDINILPKKSLDYFEKLPSAGYVNFNDIKMSGFTFDRLSVGALTANDIFQGDYLWIADDFGNWKVITPIPIGTIDKHVNVINVRNNFNNTATFEFDSTHSLVKDDTFMVVNYDSTIDGFYRVNSVDSITSVVVDLAIPSSTTSISSLGIASKFQTQRITSTKEIANLRLVNDGVSQEKVWVDNDQNGRWAVYQKDLNYKYTNVLKKASTQKFGNSIAFDKNLGVYIGDPGNRTVYRYTYSKPGAYGVTSLNANTYEYKESVTLPTSGFGTAIAKSEDVMVITSPGSSSYIYIGALHPSSHKSFVVHQTITVLNRRVGDSVALSGDKKWLYLGSTLEAKVYVYKLDDIVKRVNVGFTLSSPLSINATKFVVSGDRTNDLGHGDRISFTDAASTLFFFSVFFPSPKTVETYVIETSEYDLGTNKTTFHIQGNFKTTAVTGNSIFKNIYTYTSNAVLSIEDIIPAWSSSTVYSVGKIVCHAGATYIAIGGNTNQTPSTNPLYWKVTNTGFATTLSTNFDGTKLFVSAPSLDVTPTKFNMGAVYVYSRLIQNIYFVRDPKPWNDIITNLAWAPTNSISVLLNGKTLLPTTDYTVSDDTVTFKYPLTVGVGDIVNISSGDFVFTQTLTPYDYSTTTNTSIAFGTGLDTNIFGNDVLVGAPFDISSNNYEGAVYRFTHEGKKYGTVTGIRPVTLSSAAVIFINGFAVPIPGTGVTDIVDAINGLGLSPDQSLNVGATEMPGGILQLYLIDNTVGKLNDKLTISAFDKSVLDDLGIAEYTNTQVIREVHSTTYPTQFGYSVKFNEYNSVAIGAPTASRFAATTFDFIDDSKSNNDTYFDNNFTRFVDSFANAGSVSIYDYIPEYNESLNNLGSFVFAQTCNDLITNIGPNAFYGKRIAFSEYGLVVGIPDSTDNTGFNGRVVVYRNNINKPNWNIFRKSNEIVDIDRLSGVQIYNNDTNERIQSLDYIDPLQGKLLGVVMENLDYIDSIDPAGYNTDVRNHNLVWSSDHVGRLWFDTSSTRFVNYHQEDTVYNSKYWGTVFPDSIVSVYTWIESDVTPVNYEGNGIAYDLESYTTTVEVDSAGSLVLKYYYWVKNTNVIQSTKGKTLSDTILELYIANPTTSGVPFFAPYKPNVFGLYNASEFISDITSSLYIGFSSGNNDTPAYNEYKLIRAGYEDDFISGIPSMYTEHTEPEAMYEKMLDSLAGMDSQGRVVPDISLPKLMQTGTSYRPRQSMFKNRLKALANYFGYANNVLKQYPIAEFKTPSLLGSSNSESSTVRAPTFFTITGTDFDTTKYWEYTYWWAEGYSVNTKIDVEVAKYYGLATLIPYVGMIAGVTMNSEGKREVYAYNGTSWDRVGLEQGTIQIKESLWDYANNKIGFDSNFFDLDTYDAYPSMETRYIIRALNEQIYTETLRIHRNKSLILLFEYIVSENTTSQNNLTWLNKTSLVDVHHTLRELAQDKNYKRDNQVFLEGYINEVKPYRVVIKEFLLKYNKTETYFGRMTDFDLPGRYNENTGKFITPNLVFDSVRTTGQFLPTDTIWADNDYSDWFNNYGISLTGQLASPITTVAVYLDTISNVVYVKEAFGLPVTGRIKIDDEYIDYSEIDREKGLLSSLTRGANDSDVADHIPGTTVYIDLPGVVLLDSGRDYIDPPQISAVVDTTIYPAPTKPATLVPVMSNGKVIDITVTDPGLGYTTKPDIIIQASVTVLFDSANINYQDNTINVNAVSLLTGDSVKYTKGPASLGISGLQNKKYYYVRVISTDSLFYKNSVIALYTTKNNAMVDSHRVNLAESVNSINNKLEVTARAVPIVSNSPTRELTSTLKFDRTSYRTKVEQWSSGEYYGSTVTSSGAESSLDLSVNYAIPYPGLTGTASRPDGTTFGNGAVFTIYNILFNLTYDTEITFEGESYQIGDVITISGANLGGVSTSNDCTLTVTAISGLGGIQAVTVTGTPSTVTRASIQQAILPITTVSSINASVASATVGTFYSNKFTAAGTLQGAFVKGMILSGGSIPAYTVYITEVVTAKFTAEIFGTSVVKILTGTSPKFGMVVTGYSVPANTFVVGVSGSDVSLSNIIPKTPEVQFIDFTGIMYNLNTNVSQAPTAITGTAGDAVVTLNYVVTNLKPGQIKGLQLYFYKIISPYTYIDTRPGGATIKVYKPNFAVQSITNEYFIQIIDPGTRYVNNDTLLIKGSLLGGVDGANDAKINIIMVDNSGGVNVYELHGVAVNTFEKYYVKPISSTQVALYYDAALLRNVPNYDFTFHSGDYAYIPEPIYITSGHIRSAYSLVTYNNTLYRCLVSNNDKSFDFNKWEEVRSDDIALNALDRIMGFYNPTDNMPGKNLPMLVSGIDYPNNTYFGQDFDDTINELDTVLKDQIFYPSNINLRGVITTDNEVCVAIGDTESYSIILLSYDSGVNWSIKQISKNVLGVQDITYNDGHYVIVTKNLNAPVLTSNDLVNWVSVGEFTPYDINKFDEVGYDSSSISAPKDKLYSVIYNNNFYIAVGDELLISSDSYTWSVQYSFGSSLPQQFNRVAYVSSTFFDGYIATGLGTIAETDITGYTSLLPTSKTFRSLNGLDWEEVLPRITPTGLNVILSSGNVIVVAGDNYKIYSSTNSYAWDSVAIDGQAKTDNLLNGLYANGVFIVVGDNGSIVTSYDGINWNEVNSNTTESLTAVTFTNNRWIIVGNNATILRSDDAVNWDNISLIKTGENFYQIKGDPFISGYGPEELVPSVLTDTLTMTITTRPGSTWAVEDYPFNGFTVKTFTNQLTDTAIDFSLITENPAQIAVYVMDSSTNLGFRIYEDITPTSTNNYTYAIDWIKKLITLSAFDGVSLYNDTLYLQIEVYEFGNGNQEVRGNSQSMPLRIDPVYGHSEIWLNYAYNPTVYATPVVYLNGSPLVYLDDYVISTTATKQAKLLFNTTYNSETHYLSFAIMGSVINEKQNSYSIPEIQVFEVIPSTTTLTLMNFVGLSADGYTNDVNAKVEYNGRRLIPTTEYSIDIDPSSEIGTVTLNFAPATSEDLICVTTFHDTRDQYLLTENITTLRVTPLIFVSTDKDELTLFTTIEPEFVAGDLITIDGIVGTTQLNGNEYYARLLNPYTEDTVTYYPIKLFYDSLLSKPVTGKILTVYVSGGYIWKSDNTHTINQPDLTLTNVNRLFVTINGYKVDNNRLKLSGSNKLNILEPISSGDTVLITSMITNPTPNQMVYVNHIDKNGEQMIYRANSGVRTWLTQNLEVLDNKIYVEDVAKLLDLVKTTVVATTVNNTVACFVNYEVETIKEISVYNISTLTQISPENITLSIRNSRPVIYISDGASENDNLEVSLRLGNTINIDGEIITFKKVNTETNVISGITRGVNGSGARKMHLAFSPVYGVKLTNTLFNYYYNRTWNSEEYTLDGDPLQVSDSFPANFLQVGTE